MKRFLLALALVNALANSALPAEAAPACTDYLSAGAAIPAWVQPGTVLCLHTGNYVHATLRLTSNSAVYQAAPGEFPRLVGADTEIYGHDVTLSGLELDGDGIGQPVVVLRGNDDTLAGNNIHNGRYNGVDVRGQSDTIIGNQIHDFNSGVAQDDAQCANLISNNLAGSPGDFRLLNNRIWNCSGDGVQAYHANVLPCPASVAPGIIAGNVFTAGTIPFLENAFDLKFGSWSVYSNTISGYGFIGQTGSTDTSPAGFIHKCVSNTLVSGNTFDHNGKGLEVLGNTGLDAGTNPVSITVSGNTFSFTGPGYVINVVNGLKIVIGANQIYPNGQPTATRTPVPTPTVTRTPTATATPSPVSVQITCTRTTTWDGRVTTVCP